MPVRIQITMLTRTALILITAETGPVGPSFIARTTNSSAITPLAPASNPVYKVSLSIKELNGILITPKTESKTTNKAQMKSANKLYLRKVRLDRILVQYFAIFILAESISIARAESINISFRALDEF